MENRVTGNEKKRSKSKIVVIILLAVVLIAAIVGTQTPIVSNAIESKKVAAAESRCEQVIKNVFNKLNVQGAESFNFDYAIFRDVENGYSDVEVYGNHDEEHEVMSRITGKLAESYYDQLVVAESGKRSDYLKVLQTCLENLEQKKIEKTDSNIDVSAFSEEQAKNFVNFFDTENRNVVAVMPTYCEHQTFTYLKNGNCGYQFTLKVMEIVEDKNGTNISLQNSKSYFAQGEDLIKTYSVVEREYKITWDAYTKDIDSIIFKDPSESKQNMMNKWIGGNYSDMYIECISETQLNSTTKNILDATNCVEFN